MPAALRMRPALACDEKAVLPYLLGQVPYSKEIVCKRAGGNRIGGIESLLLLLPFGVSQRL